MNRLPEATQPDTTADNGWHFKVRVEVETTARLEAQKIALGFHTANALAAIYVHALSKVPPAKVFEALSVIRRFSAPESPRKASQ